jgi:hypothetical protein
MIDARLARVIQHGRGMHNTIESSQLCANRACHMIEIVCVCSGEIERQNRRLRVPAETISSYKASSLRTTRPCNTTVAPCVAQARQAAGRCHRLRR